MAVAKLCGAAALPGVEGFFRRRVGRRRIAIEDRHLAFAVAERQRRTKARNARAGDENGFVRHA